MLQEVLLLTNNLNTQLDWPATQYSDLPPLIQHLKSAETSPLYIVVKGVKLSLVEAEELLTTLNGSTEVLIAADDFTLDQLQKLFSTYPHLVIFQEKDLENLNTILLRRKEISAQKISAHTYEQLYEEQMVQLHKQESETERLIKEEQERVDKSQKRAETTLVNAEAFYNSLIVINKAKSVSAIETGLKEVLETPLNLEVVRVLYPQNEEGFLNQLHAQSTPYFCEKIDPNSIHSPSIVFVRPNKNEFNRAHVRLLREIVECIQPSLLRIENLEKFENLKNQWELTFDSISEAIGVFDENLVLIKGNKEFRALLSKLTRAQVEFIKAFPFLKSWIIEATQKGSFEKEHQLNIDDEEVTFRVSMSRVSKNSFVCTFKDNSEEVKLERQIIESSKVAELGLIGSSIAHELNNPIGGMLSYLQLIKMDMSPQHELYSDIIDMEAATIRCKDIVENLLGFSRSQAQDAPEPINIEKVIRETVEIAMLQSRYQHVDLDLSQVHENLPLLPMKKSCLIQSLHNTLLNSLEAIAEKLAEDPNHKGKIWISTQEKEKIVEIKIKDNGVGITQESIKKIFNPLFSTKSKSHHVGLGLTIAYQLTKENGGNLEIHSQPNIGTTAIFSFGRPDLNSNRQVFDRQN